MQSFSNFVIVKNRECDNVVYYYVFLDTDSEYGNEKT